MLTSAEMQRYSRHLALPGFGVEAQQRLKSARVLVVGAGGLGAPALLYLAAAGVGTLGIVDDDRVEESNLQRQILFSSAEIGTLKTEQAAKRLRELNPHVDVEIFNERLRADNAERIIRNFDVVIDGSDNFATRYLINDACVVLDKPFVAASILKFEGQLSVFNLKQGQQRGPTYRCLFPEPPSPEQAPSCSEAGVLGALAGIIGSFQALETLKLLSGVGEALSGKLLCFDGLTGIISYVRFVRDEKLAQSTVILDDAAYSLVCRNKAMSPVKVISVKELSEKLQNKEDLHLVDVREAFEREIASLGGSHIPLAALASQANDIPRDKEVIVYCRSGGRSQRAVEMLQEKFGFTNLKNLQGGVLAWADQIDPHMKKY
ncbi:MAG: molybdopterin-synthase adenylyltransferase MoeB [Deltaproteobacteria bacterium]|nr:molybdopterin-synthase adenylyltransferase MoeB [Deltaproteobacteria bacterium]